MPSMTFAEFEQLQAENRRLKRENEELNKSFQELNVALNKATLALSSLLDVFNRCEAGTPPPYELRKIVREDAENALEDARCK